MQNLQDFFSKSLNLSLLCIYENNWITEPSNTNDFCFGYTRKSSKGAILCNECNIQIEQQAKKEGKPIITECHAGLKVFAVPVVLDGKYIGCVLGGGVLANLPNQSHFFALAKELGINEKKYIDEMHNLNILPEEKIKAAVDILFAMTNSLVAIAHTNNHLKKLGIDYKFPRNIKLEEWFLNSYTAARRPISAREFEVLQLLVQGKSNNEIAKELFISVHTAKAHVSSILEKFQVTDRVQVAVKAVREGLI